MSRKPFVSSEPDSLQVLNAVRAAGLVLVDPWDDDYEPACRKGCGCSYCVAERSDSPRYNQDFAFQIRKEAMTRVCRRRSCRKTGCICDD